MKKSCLFTLILLCLANVQINAQSWQWGKTINCIVFNPYGVSTLNEGAFVTSGINEDVYTTGTFIGIFSLYTCQLYNSPDTSYSKYDSSGDLLWSYAATDANQSFPLGITTEQAFKGFQPINFISK